MEEKRYVWKQRSEEWIAANPGKPTLYREEVPLVKHITIDMGDDTVSAIIPLGGDEPAFDNPFEMMEFDLSKGASDVPADSVSRDKKHLADMISAREAQRGGVVPVGSFLSEPIISEGLDLGFNLNQASDVPAAPAAKVKKESGKDAGVYVIRYGDWCYVGYSNNVPVRIRNHKMKIRKGEETELNSGRFAIDVQKFGVQSFSFAFTRKLPFASKQELMSAQEEVMLSILSNGWKLYNKDIPSGVMGVMLNEVKGVGEEED